VAEPGQAKVECAGDDPARSVAIHDGVADGAVFLAKTDGGIDRQLTRAVGTLYKEPADCRALVAYDHIAADGSGASTDEKRAGAEVVVYQFAMDLERAVRTVYINRAEGRASFANNYVILDRNYTPIYVEPAVLCRAEDQCADRRGCIFTPSTKWVSFTVTDAPLETVNAPSSKGPT
jgi:hypothetical protein